MTVLLSALDKLGGFVLYLILKWLHVLSAITALGANFTYPLWTRIAAGDAANTRFALRGISKVEILANIAYGVLLVTGFTMVFVGRLPLTTPWILSAIILYIIMGGLAARGYTPALRKQIQLAEIPGPTSEEYKIAEEHSNRLGMILVLIAVAIEFLMTVKPALWG